MPAETRVTPADAGVTLPMAAHAMPAPRHAAMTPSASAGSPQEARRPPDPVGTPAPALRLRAVLARREGGALDRHALGEQKRIAFAGAGRRPQPVLAPPAQHAPPPEGPRQPRRHLGVA